MLDRTSQSKRDLRSTIKARLAELSPQQLHDGSVAACQRVLQLESFAHASVVMMYMPLDREVDVTPIALQAFRAGKTVCVPRVDWERHDMTPVEVTSIDDRTMEVDEHNLRTPRSGRLVMPSLIDLVIVPGLAFDTSGNRLGRGGGFYDRFLARLRPGTARIGVCFDLQIIDRIPHVEQDMAVDLVATDRRLTGRGVTSPRSS
jgi:5-formyltetrahydrofolate cyclo-ligase